VVPPDEGRRHHSQLLRIIPKLGVIGLVFLQEALAQVEDGRGPKPYEDRRLAPARKVERKRDHNRDEGPSNVDSLVAVHMLYLPVRLFGILYPEVSFVNPEGKRLFQDEVLKNLPSTHSGGLRPSEGCLAHICGSAL